MTSRVHTGGLRVSAGTTPIYDAPLVPMSQSRRYWPASQCGTGLLEADALVRLGGGHSVWLTERCRQACHERSKGRATAALRQNRERVARRLRAAGRVEHCPGVLELLGGCTSFFSRA
jgi:hypothetical protein